MWTQGGRYLGTLGTVLPWSKLTPFERAGENNRLYRLPPDIKKVASSTTLKVISGIQHNPGYKRRKGTEDHDDDRDVEDTATTDLKSLFDKPLKDPILGKHFCLPGRSAIEQTVELDTKQLYIPIYTHLRVYPSEIIESLPTPPIIEQVKSENYLKHYLPVQGKVDLTSSAINIREPQRLERRIRAGGDSTSAENKPSYILPTQDKIDFDMTLTKAFDPQWPISGPSTSRAASVTGFGGKDRSESKQRFIDQSMKMSSKSVVGASKSVAAADTTEKDRLRAEKNKRLYDLSMKITPIRERPWQRPKTGGVKPRTAAGFNADTNSSSRSYDEPTTKYKFNKPTRNTKKS